MLERIKYLLYELRIIKPVKMEDKIKYLLYNKIDVYILGNKLKKFYNKDIVTSNVFIKYLLTRDFKVDYVDELLSYSMYHISYKNWYTDNSHIISDDNIILNEWLENYYELYKVYERYIQDKDGVKAYVNATKLKTYIINVEEIINDLLNIYINKKG